MYDAMGVRRQAGYHATAINNLVTAFPSRDALAEHQRTGASGSGGGYQSSGGGGVGNRGGSNESAGGANGVAESTAGEALLGGDMADVAESLTQGFQDLLTALQERPLREHIGHTPVQVLAGGVLGVVVGTAYALALKASEAVL
jgi:acid phosphatase family membrane protein YuiD